jgi:hypothetical protein
MEPKRFYLKPNVIIGPLVDRWYAWFSLIAHPLFNYACCCYKKQL